MIDLSNKCKEVNYTDEQKRIIESSDDSIFVNAYAGTGKSSVLMGIANKYKKGLYLAFNKAIVEDILPKLPNGWTCSTFNSFGLRMIKKEFGNVKVNFNKYSKSGRKNKPSILAQKHMSMCGSQSITSWKKTCNRFFLNEYFIEEAREILKEGKANTKVISGEDMLQYPIENGWKSSEHYDVILVDECQDLSLQQIVFLQCIKADKIVFVGDKFQQIYGFRGSDPEVFEKIVNVYNPIEYSMTQSFRCPQVILDKTKEIVPKVWSDIKIGEVEDKVGFKDISFEDNCLIISRVNSELIKLANHFIRNNIDFSINDKFVRKLKLEMKYAKKNCKNLKELKHKLCEELDNAIDVYKKNNWSIHSLITNHQTMVAVLNCLESIDEIDSYLNNISFKNKKSNKRKLMTIHAAKGLENENVYFLKPHIRDMFKSEAITQWEKEEEDHLFYVACTRSLRKLIFIH